MQRHTTLNLHLISVYPPATAVESAGKFICRKIIRTYKKFSIDSSGIIWNERLSKKKETQTSLLLINSFSILSSLDLMNKYCFSAQQLVFNFAASTMMEVTKNWRQIVFLWTIYDYVFPYYGVFICVILVSGGGRTADDYVIKNKWKLFVTRDSQENKCALHWRKSILFSSCRQLSYLMLVYSEKCFFTMKVWITSIHLINFKVEAWWKLRKTSRDGASSESNQFWCATKLIFYDSSLRLWRAGNESRKGERKKKLCSASSSCYHMMMMRDGLFNFPNIKFPIKKDRERKWEEDNPTLSSPRRAATEIE